MHSFSELNLSPELAKSIEQLGFERPTPIQSQTIPQLLNQSTDFLGLASTGTGKTAAFGIPLLERIDLAEKQIQGLVLCPTRELAIQVADQIQKLGQFKKVKVAIIYGGVGFSDQIQALKRQPSIVVATPGRLLDHLERKTLSLKAVNTVILDEADEMISMGFQEDLELILKQTSAVNRKIWLFSATLSPELRRVTQKYLREPKTAEINREQVLSQTVEQLYYVVRDSNRIELVSTLLNAAHDFYGIIFCQTKLQAQELTDVLKTRGFKADCLHGDLSQAIRERTFKLFRERKVNVLVCTDVAARGLDVKDLTHVINFSIPQELEAYVHRIGRTARSGKSGTAITLVSPTHLHQIGRLERMTKSKMKRSEIPKRKEVAAQKVKHFLKDFLENQTHAKALELLDEDWMATLNEMIPSEVAARFMAILFKDLFEEKGRTELVEEPVENFRDARQFSKRPGRFQGRFERPRYSSGSKRPFVKDTTRSSGYSVEASRSRLVKKKS